MFSFHEVIHRISQLRLIARRIHTGRDAGLFQARTRGSGLEFDELRAYEPGDNVRSIDWKSSARANKLMTRLYYEESRRSVMLLVDLSASGSFASGSIQKISAIKECAVLVACAAEYGNDEVGFITFGKDVEQYRPPKAGRSYIHNLCVDIMQAPEAPGVSSFAAAFADCVTRMPRRSLVILISDGLGADLAASLPAISARHDLVVVRVYDQIERQWPAGLVVGLQDPESGVALPANPLQMQALADFMQTWRVQQDLLFKQYGVQVADIAVSDVYEERLVQFFNQRR